MKSNPDKAIQAVINPHPITLGQIALLDRVQAPFLYGDYSHIEENGVALWIYKTSKESMEKCVKEFNDRERLALEMLNSMSVEEYADLCQELYMAVKRFNDMLPNPEPDEERDAITGELIKKKAQETETDGLLKSESGCAGHIITRLITPFTSFLRFMRQFFTGRMRKE